MATLTVQGGRRLVGTVQAAGRKNAALPLIAASLLAGGPTRLENVPRIRDVYAYRALVAGLGAVAEYRAAGRTLWVDPAGVRPGSVDPDLAGSLRASYYLVGVLLARFGQADVPLPGGDRIGQRPVDQHLKALAALGAQVRVEGGRIRATARRLTGATIFFDVVSVGATIQAMLAAVLARGTTVLLGAAREPHVVDVANFLMACGADIHGAGTDTIRIRGVPELRGGVTHTVIPDDVDAATFLLAGAITGGDVTVAGVIPAHLAPVLTKLREAGLEVHEGPDCVRVVAQGQPRGITLTTRPYPGFPTDVQPPMTALLALAVGESTVTETLYEDRFRHVPELMRMGARIRVQGRTALIWGVPGLEGAAVEATDIRAGAALVLAGLAALGQTSVRGAEHIERGYDDLCGRLAALGAQVAWAP